jgi:acyl-coenzyme A synthetase/AMP-(fatty) acid ligase
VSVLFNAVKEAAMKHKKKAALIWKGVTLSYEDLVQQVQALSLLYPLKQKVAIYFKNPLLFSKAYFGVLESGGDVIIIHEKTTVRELEQYIEQSGADLLLTDNPQFMDLPIRVLVLSPETKLDSAIKRYESSFGIMDNQIIFPTSGSTSNPKYVVFKETNLLWNACAHNKHLNIRETHTILNLLPLTSIFAHVTQFLSQLLNGGTIVLYSDPFFAQNLYTYIRSFNINSFGCVPTHLRMLLKALPGDGCLQSLDYILVAGAPLGANEYNVFVDTFNTRIVYAYGLTEAGPRVACSLPGERFVRNSHVSVGRPLEGVEVKIVNEDVVCAPFSIGEIHVKSPSIMKGYLNNSDETKRALMNDWLATGDLGFKDSSGLLFVVGRKKNTMSVGGRTIHPEEIEECLLSLGLDDAAVTSIEDSETDERIVAFIVDKRGLGARCVKDMLYTRLSSYKVPHSYKVVDEIPKNRNGKIERYKLRELWNGLV